MEICIKAKDLKYALEDIAPMVKKSEMSNSMLIEYDGKLHLAIDCGAKMEIDIEVIHAIDAVNTGMTVWFQDISELLSAKGEVSLVFNQFDCDIVTDNFSSKLFLSDAIITRPIRIQGESKVVDFTLLSDCVTALSSTYPIAKAMQVDKPISINKSFGYIKYPTVWFKHKAVDIDTTLSLDYFKLIKTFQPTSVIINPNVLEFHRHNGMLQVPNNVSEEERTFDDIANDIKTEHYLVSDNFYQSLQKLNKILKNEVVRTYIYEKGAEFAITSNKVNISEKVNCDGKLLFSFNVPLEFLLCIFNIAKDTSFHIGRKGDMVCLRSNILTILLSVQ